MDCKWTAAGDSLQQDNNGRDTNTRILLMVLQAPLQEQNEPLNNADAGSPNNVDQQRVLRGMIEANDLLAAIRRVSQQDSPNIVGDTGVDELDSENGAGISIETLDPGASVRDRIPEENHSNAEIEIPSEEVVANEASSANCPNPAES